ncbi:hypothetical protein AVEN_63084-1 [Araneus ventricosus]|uniref:Uncharacterized protein n=1 Tax=Araneus ventricosus TaxID=182803 RepID=A0A4Y2I7P3_ARAVE|nr:hypothetical protein AVEN_63084-1 [Araneus ventricosus]
MIGDTKAVDAVLVVHASSKLVRCRRPSRLVKQNGAFRCGSADSPIQCRSNQAQVFSEHTPADTVGYGIVQQTPLLTKRHVNYAYSGPIEHRDWTMDEWKRVACPMNPDFSFITSMACQGTPSAMQHLLPFNSRSGQAGGGIKLWDP